jgi:diamine N-acetyltransferase
MLLHRRGSGERMVSCMNIELREVTQDNLEDLIRLQPTNEQKAFVSPVVYSIAESKVSPEEIPLAIYEGDLLVGFIMFGTSPSDGRYWSLRLMIDERYQHKGYARAAEEQALRQLRERPGCTEVLVSYEPGNTSGVRLYESLGFRPTGEMRFGEAVATLRLA